MKRRLLLTAMSLFLVAQSWKLISNVPRFSNDSIWISLFLAIIFNLFVTGIFAFAVFAHPVEQLLPNRYYRPAAPKRLKWWGKLLRVGLFQRFLLATVWRSRDMQKGFFNGRRDHLLNFETETKKSEFGHLWPFFILTVLCVYFVTYDLWWLSLFTMLINIIFNFYPVLLQRTHRLRLWPVLERIKKRSV